MSGLIQHNAPLSAPQVLGLLEANDLTDLAADLDALNPLRAAYVETAGSYTQAQNTSATTVTGATFALATYQGARLEYCLTRGAGVVRQGTLQVAGDSSAPSPSDSAAVVGTPGITWSATVAAGVVSIKIAVDNSIGTGINLRFSIRKYLVP